jgi:DNA-binding GntR family transcriptional regulator
MSISLETLAIGWSAERATPGEIAMLRNLANKLAAARRAREESDDRRLIAAFQLGAYKMSRAPLLTRAIRDLWLLAGPYMHLLYPTYIARVDQSWRRRLCDALEARDAEAARREIDRDLRKALTYIAGRANADDRIGLRVNLQHDPGNRKP